MNIAYCTAVFPCLSETFVQRELAFLRSRGVNVRVWALTAQAGAGSPHDLAVVYRPSRFSLDTVRSIASLCSRPWRALAVLALVGRLAFRCPTMAGRLLANLHAVAYFTRDARRHGVSLVHGCFVNLPALVAMGVSALTGLPFTFAGHSRDVYVEGAALPLTGGRARLILACNVAAAEHMRSRLAAPDRGKLEVVHHGLSIDPPCRLQSASSERGPLLVAAGRFVPKKGFDHLLRALAILRDRGVDVRLILVGQGPLADALRDLAEQLGVSHLISWPGWVSETAIQSLLHQASILVVPSVVAGDGDRDGIPNIVLEAWAAGLPVIASGVGGLAEAVSHEANGLLVRPAHPIDLADGIARMLSDRELRERLSGNAGDCLREQFNLQENGNRLLNLFARACDGHWAA